jgi:NAD(P)-dependent dehydrogenase (short-subunit alcohol dehydrogenase family)
VDLELTGKAFLVTGASSGLGYVLAERLLAEGASVGILARDGGRLAAAAAQLAQLGGDVLEVAGDVTHVTDLESFVAQAGDRWGRIDGIVNNAGRHAAGPFADQDDAAWEEDLALKLMAAVRLSRIVLPALRASRGMVLNTLSVLAKAPDAASTPTSVSRAAGLALTKALSRELAPDGVRVNAILLGVLESPQLDRNAAASRLSREGYHSKMVSDCQIPLGRVGRPREFADLASFLLSPRSSYITGAAVNLDGGMCPVT